MKSTPTNNHSMLFRNSQQSRNTGPGCLSVEVLSVYDLPYSRPPTSVSISIPHLPPAMTGSPTGRHKDRNSYRFSPLPHDHSTTTEQAAHHHLQLKAPLRSIYESKVTVQVHFAKQPVLTSTYDISQLRLYESKWLILSLNPDANATTTPAGEVQPNDDDYSTKTALPTIRLKMTLSGPYRSEVMTGLSWLHTWLELVDKTEATLTNCWNAIPPTFLLPAKISVGLLVLGAIPLITTMVVASPMVAGLVLLAFPIFLPLIGFVVTIIMGTLVSSGVLLLSRQGNRTRLADPLSRVLEPFLSSRDGQRLVYDTGPRPTPLRVARRILPPSTHIWSRLVVSLLIDMAGSSTYLLPGVGEAFDVAWAPIQTVLIMALYDESVSKNLKYASFAEEILPFTDVIPTATIGWVCEFVPTILVKSRPGNHESLTAVTVPK